MFILDLLIYLLVLAVCLVAVVLNVVSLPGNWLMLAIALILSACHGWSTPHWAILLVMLIILLLAEVIEFLSGMIGAKKFGASRPAAWAAMAGAIIGGIVGIPPLTGILLLTDHLIGAILGAFLAAWIIELLRRRPMKEASFAALGAGLGRGVGIVTKIGGGMLVWILLAITAFPFWNALLP